MDGLFDAFCGTTPGGCDQVGVWLAALLTLLVFSFLLGDTFLFRLAQSLLVGAAIGYGSAVILRAVLWDRLLAPLLSDSKTLWSNSWPLFAPLVLGLLLLTKLLPGWSRVGNISLGYLFGIGGALAIGGALMGALGPQLGATVLSLSPSLGPVTWINNLLIVVGVITVLLAFRFTQGSDSLPGRAYSTLARVGGQVGSGFMMVAFGAILASVLTARVSTLVGQLYFLLHDWLHLVK